MPHFTETLERNAAGYARFRPGYPAEIASRIAEVTGLVSGVQVLEVGCGTGQATGFFKAFEPRQVCLDPGEDRLNGLCDEIHVLIERRFGGRIEKTMTTYGSIYVCV